MEHQVKKTIPWVPVGHPSFKWTSGADVQRTWRKFGWTPPSEGKPVFEEKKDEVFKLRVLDE